MKNKHYILTTLLLGYSFTVMGQQTSHKPDRTLADTINIGYQLETRSETSSYSISGVNANVFEKSSSIDISKALYGKIAGLNVYQGVGSSANNISGLSVHGNAPLVLIDGYPRNIDDISSAEIESVYLLKDAAATALYGIRGANGVLMITSKRGSNDKAKISVDYHFGVNTQFRAPKFANAYTYATTLNEALRADGLSSRYNEQELLAFKNGTLPFDFPNVNWWKNTLNNRAYTHNLKFSYSGGNDKFKYFTHLDFYRDRSMFKENTRDSRYSTRPTDTRLSLRSNFDVAITPTTNMKVGLLAKLQETNGSVINQNTILSSIYNTPAAAFPIRYSNNIYGGSSVYGDKNPVALLKDKGHRRSMYGSLIADLSLSQKLDVITEGLSAEVSVAFDNIGGMQESSSKQYRYMNSYASLSDQGNLITTPIIYGRDSKELGHSQPFERLLMRNDIQTKIAYDRTFDKHQVSGAVVYDVQSTIQQGRNNTIKNQSLLFNASYIYDNRYILNGVINYSGSAYLPKNHKFKTYPALSAAWVISNEEFMKNLTFIDFLKLRASYGISGWDGNLTHELWRESYGGGNHYFFGENATIEWGGSEGSLPVEGLTAEKSRKATLGLDFALFKNRLSASLDGFYEKRSDVLVSGSNSTSGIIGIGVGMQNAGEYEYKGLDASINWSDKINDFSYGIGGSFSYLTTKVINENQAFQEYDYLYHKGNRIGQMYGLEAIGFFENEMDINNSPVQTFSPTAPGDIKYKDQNGDNRIDEKDMVKMFGSSIPRFYFGFDLYFSYKNFEISADFQGMTGVTTSLLNSPLYKPLANNGNISTTFLNRETYWTPENKANATMPRLTTLENKNNYRASSLWFRDGSFLKLRNLVISYTFTKSQTKFADIKVFLQGNNLFSLDNIHFADPEQLQMAYPSIRSYWTGIKFKF